MQGRIDHIYGMTLTLLLALLRSSTFHLGRCAGHGDDEEEEGRRWRRGGKEGEQACNANGRENRGSKWCNRGTLKAGPYYNLLVPDTRQGAPLSDLVVDGRIINSNTHSVRVY